jgi:hypothetical protein
MVPHLDELDLIRVVIADVGYPADAWASVIGDDG